MLTVGAEGHGLLSPQPGHEVLVGPHQPVGLDRKDAGSQIIDDLVCPVGLIGDFGIEPDERLAHPLFHHHVAALAREKGGWRIIPAGWLELFSKRLPPTRLRFLTSQRRPRSTVPGKSIQNHLLDGVGFGEGHLTTSQWPPLAGPIRRSRPSFRNLMICFSTARVEIARASARSGIVMSGVC